MEKAMTIRKRDGSTQTFDVQKIKRAMVRAFASVDHTDYTIIIDHMCDELGAEILSKDQISVEEIQDLVENKLMQKGHFQTAKNYIRYRAEHEKTRELIKQFDTQLQDEGIRQTLVDIQKDFGNDERYSLALLHQKFLSFINDNISLQEKRNQLIKSAVELTTKESPKWEFIAARLLCQKACATIDRHWRNIGIHDYPEKIAYLCQNGYMGKYIVEHYSSQDLAQLHAAIDYSRDYLFTYSGLDLVVKRYLIKTGDNKLLEKPQEMFMGIAMHLAIPEGENRIKWATKIYNAISQMQLTLATPTMSNARKPYHQLSSCFIDTVPDSLDGIYRSIDNFAQVSKLGGGMGMYFGKVRATGSDIRGYKGVAGGVIRWIKLANDTSVAVDQLGMRQGAVAVYLDAWHKDLPEFLQLRTNNGDDRNKAHDIFPAVCYPNYFWDLVDTQIDSDWYLMCPHEILDVKGYALEDSFGDEWKERYLDCVQDQRIDKRVISVKDLVRLIIKSATETGTPFTFNRDAVNRANPNPHKGMIYCSNLCTEIAQNMSAIESLETKIVEQDGETIVVKTTKPGDFVVCNLASLVLGNIDVKDRAILQELIRTAVRALDNVISLNYYPVPYAEITNARYRAIGLGINGYHHMLANYGIRWESQEHLDFVDDVMENINYFTIEASSDLAKEKGNFPYFEGSDWQTGDYYDKRNYNSTRWQDLRNQTSQYMRNGYLLAVAPTSSTSIIAGTSASVDPIMNRFFLEEKKGSITPRVAPNLNPENFWLYKSAHTIDQSYVIRAAAIRTRHIDQAQSLNLYITTDFTMRQVLNLFVDAYKAGIKSIYYVRSKSLDVEECDVCSS